MTKWIEKRGLLHILIARYLRYRAFVLIDDDDVVMDEGALNLCS